MHLIFGLVDGDVLGVIVGDKILCTIYVYLLLNSAFNGNLVFGPEAVIFSSSSIDMLYEGDFILIL